MFLGLTKELPRFLMAATGLNQIRKEATMSWKSVVQKRAAVKGDILVVGVDIGKRSHVGATFLRDGSTPRKFRFYNDGRGFSMFLERLMVWKAKGGYKAVVVGLESTGHYGECLAYWLHKHGIKVVQVNPVHVKRSKETLDNSPGKTDPKDALLIADLVGQGKYLTLVLPRGVFAELRQLVGLRKRLTVELSAKVNLLHASVDRVFPEFSTVFRGLTGKTARYILRHFPFPQEIASMDATGLVVRLRRECDPRLSRDKVRALCEEARGSVGVSEGLAATRVVLHDTLDGLEAVMEKLKGIESRIERMVAEIDEAGYMLSVKGIGVMTVAVLLSETCGMRHYVRARSILKLAGLNLFEISSGQRKGARHISKRGRSLLRKTLYLAALRQARQGAPLHDFYARLVEGGMIKMKALIAVACKLVRLLFALVRDSRYYTEQAPCCAALASVA